MARQTLRLPEVFAIWDSQSLAVNGINNPMSKLEPEMFTYDRKDSKIISCSELKI